MVVAAGSRETAQLEPFHSTPKASPSGGSPNRPPLHYRERSSSMKNRKQEICTSGTVRDEDGNILIYSAKLRPEIRGGGGGQAQQAILDVERNRGANQIHHPYILNCLLSGNRITSIVTSRMIFGCQYEQQGYEFERRLKFAAR